jgi:hypothetical protein
MTDHYTNCIRMTYYRDDDEYDREQTYREQSRTAFANVIPFPKIVHEPCGLCSEGSVAVADGTIYPGNVMCPYCCGAGYVVIEERAK